ncbi:hypothetical protein KM043_008535 [Ampulex compressa]|nr:hypothetical protein KM043_008535 [Ampulex compressa]
MFTLDIHLTPSRSLEDPARNPGGSGEDKRENFKVRCHSFKTRGRDYLHEVPIVLMENLRARPSHHPVEPLCELSLESRYSASLSYTISLPHLQAPWKVARRVQGAPFIANNRPEFFPYSSLVPCFYASPLPLSFHDPRHVPLMTARS